MKRKRREVVIMVEADQIEENGYNMIQLDDFLSPIDGG